MAPVDSDLPVLVVLGVDPVFAGVDRFFLRPALSELVVGLDMRPGRLFTAADDLAGRRERGRDESVLGRDEPFGSAAAFLTAEPRRSSSALRFGPGDVDFAVSPLIAASKSPIYTSKSVSAESVVSTCDP